MQIPMWKIHMLGSDNHTNMHKYTDRLINTEVGEPSDQKKIPLNGGNSIEEKSLGASHVWFYVLYLCAFLSTE